MLAGPFFLLMGLQGDKTGSGRVLMMIFVPLLSPSAAVSFILSFLSYE